MNVRGVNSVLAGTSFEGRAEIIRQFCREGAPIKLVREPSNPHDPKAVAAYLPVRKTFGLFGSGWKKIGYIKASHNKGFAKLMDDGRQVTARVRSFYAPPDREYPRVSILIYKRGSQPCLSIRAVPDRRRAIF